tara:strand:+ start:14557 stop:14943 length:387 start_codon:yes stop_codon:yes gene_type:complete
MQMNNLKFQFTQYFFMYHEFQYEGSSSQHCRNLWNEWIDTLDQHLNDEELSTFDLLTRDVFCGGILPDQTPHDLLDEGTVTFLEENMADFIKKDFDNYLALLEAGAHVRDMISEIKGLDLNKNDELDG